MSDTEKCYAQIEKEALASTWACEKFSDYLLCLHFLIESDHKPLIPLLGSKCLESLPPRVLRFRLRLARFNYDITHVPGKLLYTADTLSRSPLPISKEVSPPPFKSPEEVEAFIEGIVLTLPASESRLAAYWSAQQSDPVCQQVRQYCLTGWPECSMCSNIPFKILFEHSCSNRISFVSEIHVLMYYKNESANNHRGKKGVCASA